MHSPSLPVLHLCQTPSPMHDTSYTSHARAPDRGEKDACFVNGVVSRYFGPKPANIISHNNIVAIYGQGAILIGPPLTD